MIRAMPTEVQEVPRFTFRAGPVEADFLEGLQLRLRAEDAYEGAVRLQPVEALALAEALQAAALVELQKAESMGKRLGARAALGRVEALLGELETRDIESGLVGPEGRNVCRWVRDAIAGQAGRSRS